MDKLARGVSDRFNQLWNALEIRLQDAVNYGKTGGHAGGITATTLRVVQWRHRFKGIEVFYSQSVKLHVKSVCAASLFI